MRAWRTPRRTPRVRAERCSATLKRLARRWFVLRNVHAKEGTILVQPRHAITWMRGPLTRVELRAAVSGGPAGATKVSEDLAGSVGR